MSPLQQYIAFRTIVQKEVRRFLRIWVQTLVPPAITMTLYFIIFGKLIGSRIGEMGGHDYVAFVVPGLIMMAVITNAYSNVVSSFYGAKFQNNIEELLVSPTPNYLILWGFVIGGVVRGLMVGGIVLVVSVLFTDLRIDHPLWTLLVVFLVSVLFSMLGLINAIFANSFDDVSIVPTFILTPLSYLGGVFYSTDLLPETWAKLSQLNPILHMVNAFRYGMLGHSDIPVSTALGMVVGLILLSWALAAWLLARSSRLRH